MQRRSSTPHYQTFPSEPPQTKGRRRGRSFWKTRDPPSPTDSSTTSDDGCTKHKHTPLPKKQLIVLAIISLAEQTALNSISPYLPEMAATFPEVDQSKVGLIVGVIASSFAAAQFTTNVFWGTVSDRLGRKPVIVLGTFLTAVCFIAFGFSRHLWQAIVAQALMGLVNANAGIVPTVLGEITDRSNQSTAFAYLPIVYGVGSILGPILGGLMVNVSSGDDILGRFPYLLPNAVAAIVLLADMVVAILFLEESLKDLQNLPPLTARLRCAFTWLWQFMASYRPSYLRNTKSPDEDDDEPELPAFSDACPAILPETSSSEVSYREILIPQIILLLATYAIFNLCNVAYNALYPIYLASPRPTGRELSPQEIGLSLSFGGIVSILFQAFLFTPLQTRIGNLRTYRLTFLGLIISFFAMPFVGRKAHSSSSPPSQIIIWFELAAAVLLKNVATVGGLTCAMLLITNASPKPATLGLLNGLAQSLSAAGRAVGPIVSGGIFTLAIGIKKDGEFLAWGLFGAIAAIGTALSWALRRRGLEGPREEQERLLQDEEEGRGEQG